MIALVEIGIVDRVAALHDLDEAFETHPGIDVLLGKGGAGTIGGLDELHEDVVPDFQVAFALAGTAFAVAEFGTEVEVDLGVGTVRPSGTNWTPPVVFEFADAGFGDADVVAPDGVGVLVGGMDGGVEVVGIEPHDLGEEFPGPGERFLFEVVADGEVAEHEEEGAVALVADLVDVDGAKTLLDGAEADGGRGFQTEEERSHLLHAGGGEQDRGVVVGDEGGAWELAVTALLEEVDEGAADFRAAHPAVTVGSLVCYVVAHTGGALVVLVSMSKPCADRAR